MLLVINPNMALDRVAVTRFREGTTLRPIRFSLWAGGSGTHAAYVARLLGAEVCVVGFVGGHTGALLREQVTAQEIRSDLVEIAGETRQTFSLLDEERGNICDVAEYGPVVSAEDVRRLEGVAARRIPEARMVIVSGSLPEGCPAELPAKLVATARAWSVPCILDLAGRALLETAVDARPWMMKPSRVEMAELLGTENLAPSDLIPRALEWVQAGVQNVCISMDVAGLLWVSESGVKRILSPPVHAFNTIGCGDALVGALAARYLAEPDLERALQSGVAAAAANLRYDAPGYCTPEDVRDLTASVEVIAPR